jgi:uncharacterized protein
MACQNSAPWGRALENVSRYPVAFYLLATAIPWMLWFTAAWPS